MNATTNTIQPEKVWRKPSATAGLTSSAAMPVPATRAALATMATGTAASPMTRGPMRRSVKYPRTIASVISETSDRMPLHASATSSVVLARISTLPSRSTGMSRHAHRDLAEARRQQLQRKRDLVEDDRRNRNHQQQKREGNARIRRCRQPNMNRIVPDSVPRIDTRVRNSSEPRMPASSTAMLPRPRRGPSTLGVAPPPSGARDAPTRSTAPAARSESRASSCRRSPTV